MVTLLRAAYQKT